MDKKVRVILKSNEGDSDFTTNAHYDEEKNEISYVEVDQAQAKVKYNFNTNTLIRSYNGFSLLYHFVEGEITQGQISVTLEETGKVTKFDVDIKTSEVRREKNKITIKYELDKSKFEFSIEVK